MDDANCLFCSINDLFEFMEAMDPSAHQIQRQFMLTRRRYHVFQTQLQFTSDRNPFDGQEALGLLVTHNQVDPAEDLWWTP